MMNDEKPSETGQYLCEEDLHNVKNLYGVKTEEKALKILYALIEKKIGNQKRGWVHTLFSAPEWQIDPESAVQRLGVFADAFCRPELDPLIETAKSELQASYTKVSQKIKGYSLPSLNLHHIPVLENVSSIDTTLTLAIDHLKEFAEAPPDGSHVLACDGSNEGTKLSEAFNQIHLFLDDSKRKVEEFTFSAPVDSKPIDRDNISNALYYANQETRKHLDAFTNSVENLKVELLKSISFVCDSLKFYEILVFSEHLGKRDAVQAFVKELRELFQVSEKAFNSQHTVIAICGETSSGKTTLMEAIMGSPCLPTAVEANSACPIRVVSQLSLSEPVLTIPERFYAAINDSLQAIQSSITDLIIHKLPTDIPVNIASNVSVATLYNEIKDLALSKSPPRTIKHRVIGPDNIRKEVELLNSVIRLLYGLKGSPRFQTRLAYFDPIDVLKGAGEKNILNLLPTVRASCPILQTIPKVGTISFIDTPGVSEAGGSDSFMSRVDDLISLLFKVSNRIIILTQPTSTDGKDFKFLRDKATRSARGRVSLVINKFDPNVLNLTSFEDLQAKLNSYRNHFETEGYLRSDVQFLRAKILHDVSWGGAEIAKLGGLDHLTPETKLSIDANSLMVSIYGESWKDEHFGDRPITERGFKNQCDKFSKKSNFGNVMAASILPSLVGLLSSIPKLLLLQLETCLSKSISALSARLALARNKARTEDLLKALEKVQSEINHFTEDENIARIRSVIESTLMGKFMEVVDKHQVALTNNVISAITKVENSCPRNTFPDRREEPYIFNDKDCKTPQITSYVRFTTENEAHEKKEEAIQAANTILAASPIENFIESIRPDVFARVLKDECTSLNTSIASVLARENLSALSDYQKALELEIMQITKLLSLVVVPSAPIKIKGGYLKESESWWFFWSNQYFVTHFAALRALTGEILNRDYNRDKFARMQIRRGQKKLEEALIKLTDMLQSIGKGILNLIEEVKEKVVSDDPVILESLLQTAVSLKQNHEIIHTTIRSELCVFEMLREQESGK